MDSNQSVVERLNNGTDQTRAKVASKVSAPREAHARVSLSVWSASCMFCLATFVVGRGVVCVWSMAPAAPPGKRRCLVSQGVECLKVFDIISGPDRWQGSGVSPAGGGRIFLSLFVPLHIRVIVCACVRVCVCVLARRCGQCVYWCDITMGPRYQRRMLMRHTIHRIICIC